MTSRQTPNWRGISLIAALGIAFSAAAADPAAHSSVPVGHRAIGQVGVARAAKLYGRLPLAFEPNQGQASQGTQFVSHAGAYTLLLSGNRMVLALPRRGQSAIGKRPKIGPLHRKAGSKASAGGVAGQIVELSLVGGNRHATSVGENPLSGYSNYFIGSDPKRWRTHIPHFARVMYRDVYPGVDLAYYGSEARVEHDFIVRPGADPGAVTLAVDGCSGRVALAGGQAHLPLDGAEITLQRPHVYQDISGVRRSVAGRYVLRGHNRLGFRVASYDRHYPLVIDPVLALLAYSTYFGGSNDDVANGIAVDPAGNAYVVGYTISTDLPMSPQAYQPNLSTIPDTTGAGLPPTLTEDAFVVALDPSGANVLYSTYLGGTGDDRATSVAVDSSGAAYITGSTNSPGILGGTVGFPTTIGAYQTQPTGGYDCFVTKIDPTGSTLVFSTLLGGSGDDVANGIAVDPDGTSYVTGTTSSADFPLINAVQPNYAGNQDAFVSQIDPTGTTLVSSTYLGGRSEDHATAIASDQQGSIYITGWTTSVDFPVTPGALQTHLNTVSGSPTVGQNAFVAKLTLGTATTTPTLAYSTFLGGSGQDFGAAIAVGIDGAACVTGYTSSPSGAGGFPITSNAADPVHRGIWDAFVSKLLPDGSGLAYSTFLGGSDYDDGRGIAVDADGNTYVTGETASRDFPVTPNSFQAALNTTTDPATGSVSGTDAYVVAFDPRGVITFASYLGGADLDAGNAISADDQGSVYVAGFTRSTDFPTTSAIQPILAGATDAFIVKIPIPPSAPSALTARAVPGNEIDLTWTNNSASQTGIEIQRKSGSTDFSPIITLPGSATSFSDPGLVPNTVYTYEVRALNGTTGDASAFSDPATASTLPNPLAAPSVPQDFTATTLSQTQVRLSWTPNGTNQAGFKIYRRTASTGPGTLVTQVDASVVTYTDSGLTPDTRYTYWVVATNALGDSGPSNAALAVTLVNPPLAPLNLAATAPSASQIKLTWVPGDKTAVWFEVERALGNGQFIQIAKLDSSFTLFLDSGLSANTAYRYRVRATNSGGDSPYSAIIQAATGADTISGDVSASFDGVSIPISGASVGLIDTITLTPLASTTTDATGHYSFGALSDGSYTVSVLSPGQPGPITQVIVLASTVNNGAGVLPFTVPPLAIVPSGLSMASLPYDFSASSLTAASVLSITVSGTGQANIATYDPTAVTYLLYPNLPGANGTQTVPGRGYWIREDSQKPIIVGGNPVPSPFYISLAPGWNIIGDPFTRAVTVASLQFAVPVAIGTNPAGASLSFANAVAAQLVGPDVWGYNAAQNAYAATTTLQPFIGYWVYLSPLVSQGQAVTLTFTNPGP